MACLALMTAACASPRPDLPAGPAAYSLFPAPSPDSAPRRYAIGPLDVLSISVFQEPDLSASNLQVDTSGSVVLPLIGTVRASGMTANEFGEDVKRRLREQYLEDPQVTVSVTSSASQRVTVEGSVVDPGIYEIRGQTTLLDALALANGPTNVARLRDIVIFRVIDGQRTGAIFDLQQIRVGKAPDPEVYGADTVVVGLSTVKQTWRDVLSAAPIIGLFRPLYD
jgi:polysaccharide export outer membrane protein